MSSTIKLFYWIFLLIIVINEEKKTIIFCDAAPSTSNNNNNVLREVALKRIAPSDLRTTNTQLEQQQFQQQFLQQQQQQSHQQQVGNLTRLHSGDIFYVYDTPKCDTDTCVGLSSGTANILSYDNGESTTKQKFKSSNDNCKCQCLPHLTAYREDLEICVDDIHECTLAPFVSGSSSERIPFVFLPLRGQIIHPSKEISFTGVQTPLCAVSGSQFLTNTGWSELRSQDTDVPFRLFRDEGRTFLQWLGEPELRHKLQGRLILVHLLCRDMTPQTENITDDNQTNGLSKKDDLIGNQQNIFTPCVSFRVVGTPVKYVNNVTEVSFSSDTQTDVSTPGPGLSTKEYIVIAICSLLLGLIYVASVFLYLHMKKRKSESHSGSMRNAKSEINYPKNDEVIFSNGGFSRSGSISNFGGMNHTTNMMGGRSVGGGSGRNIMGHRNMGSNMNPNMASDEMGIVKNNPLLNHFPNLNDNSGFMSDLSNSNSECEEERKMKNQMQQTAMIHPSALQEMIELDKIHQLQERCSNSPSQENECLPEESVSITEDMSAEDKLENMRAIVNGTMRRKLYFNPAYFEPHLLQSPPPAAIEFLTKIREVITIAKYKMATKKYMPSLIEIPEEFQLGESSEIYSNSAAVSSRRDSVISLKRENPRHKSCTGCPGCEEMKNADLKNCQNCGDKRNSIRKWLEGVSANDTESSSDPDNEKKSGNSDDQSLPEDSLDKVKTRLNSSDTSSSSDSDTIKANSVRSKRSNKGIAPQPPNSAPKIISTSMKHVVQERDLSLKKITKSEERELSNNKLKANIEKTYAKLIDTESNSSDLYHKSSNLSHHNADIRSKIYDKVELYNKLTRNGNELYNNPQFQHSTSPVLSHRSKSSKHSQRPIRQGKKHIEVLDQFANPNPIDLRHYEMMRNINHMPDMVYEALAMDYTKMNTFRNKDYHKERQFNHFNLPTPDYFTDDDNTLKRGRNYEDPYVPTPDYNTYGRIPKKHQPDSPIYSRKSPHYLIIDYETDSLERTATNKNRISDSSPSGSSDVSSQISPSLSSALPMEEEVEIGNAVYDRVEGFRKDTESTKQHKKMRIYEDIKQKSPLISDVYVHNKHPHVKNLPPLPTKIKYNTPCEGSMTIEVEHSPQECDVSTDSDQFEPDTLDRKPKKNSNRLWSKHMIKSEECLNENDEHANYSSLEIVTSLPDLNHLKDKNQLIIQQTTIPINENETNLKDKEILTSKRSFSSLREIYEAKNQKNLQNPNTNGIDITEKGRLLTLDARHSRRQRKTNDGSLKKRVPPDVVPVDRMSTIYDSSPKSLPSHIENIARLQQTTTKLKGWNTDDDDDTTTNKPNDWNKNNKHLYETETETETDINNVITSDYDLDKPVLGNNNNNNNNNNMEFKGYFKDYSKINKLSKFNSLRKSPEAQGYISENNGCFINEMENNNNNNNNQSYGILENFITLGDVRNKHFITNNDNDKIYNNSDGNDSCCRSISPNCESPNTEQNSSSSNTSKINHNNNCNNNNNNSSNDTDTDKIEVISSKSLSTCSNLSTKGVRKNVTIASQCIDNNNHLATTKVFRVEINQSTHGMQIALGLKDRVKKTNEIKNAWKRFKSIATSKFNGSNKNDNKTDSSSDYYEKTSVLSDNIDRDDEGVFSLNDDITYVRRIDDKNIQINNLESRLSPKSELDSGYISADSNESRLQNKRYERYNFKARGSNCGGGGNNNIYDVIEDVPEIIDKKVNEKNDNIKYNTIKTSTKITPRNSIDKRKTNETIQTHKACIVEINDAIEVNVYSSDDERYSSELSGSDGEFGIEDACGDSGAESVETHSVLFKNIRKTSELN